MDLNLKYEIVKDLLHINNDFKNNYVVQSNVEIYSSFNIIDTNATSNTTNNSIYTNTSPINGGNFKYIAKDFLFEALKFGKELFSLFEENFCLYYPKYIEPGVYESSLEYKRNMPKIKSNDKYKEVCNLFFDWFKHYGFSIIAEDYSDEEYCKAISCSQIIELRNKFIILYLFFSFYTSISNFKNSVTDFNDSTSVNSYEKTEKENMKLLLKEINKFGKIIFLDFSKIEDGLIEETYENRVLLCDNLLNKLVNEINLYNSIFNIDIRYFISLGEKHNSVIYVSDNAFDLCWNTFINMYLLSKENIIIGVCPYCQKEFEKKYSQQKYCSDICLNSSNNNRHRKNDKTNLINEITNLYTSFKSVFSQDSYNKFLNEHIKDKELLNKDINITEIIKLNNTGYSRKKQEFSKKILTCTIDYFDTIKQNKKLD